MTEPQRGDRVRFIYSGKSRPATVVDVITAGRKSGVGLWRLRRRVRLLFEDRGQRWETHRDLDEVTVTAAQEQGELFEDEATA